MKKVFIFFILILSINIYCDDEVKLENIQGEITEINDGYLYLKVKNKIEKLKMAPVWYIIENDYEIEIGEKVDVTYFLDSKEKNDKKKEEDKKNIHKIESEKETYIFTDKKGREFWKRSGFFIKPDSEMKRALKKAKEKEKKEKIRAKIEKRKEEKRKKREKRRERRERK